MIRNYHELACDLAIDAAQNHIESRRGIWHLEREDLLCIYDNNPYEDAEARPRQNFRIVRRLQDADIAVLAHGHDGQHYTTSMILDCSWDRIPQVRDIIREEVEETLRELYSDP